MGDHPKAPTTTASLKNYNVLGLSKTASLPDICRAYKSLVMKWHPDKNTSNRAEAEDKIRSINEAYNVLSRNKKEEAFSNDNPKTPRNIYSSDDDSFQISSPTLLASTSTRVTPTSTPRSPSRRSVTPPPTTADVFASSPNNWSGPATPPTPSTPPAEAANLSRMTSRRNTAPIIYSHSTSTFRKKPPPIERKLECSLEDLCNGTVKKIKITRDVISHFGVILKEEEILSIDVKPGWKKGTKITFEGKGDERPGTLPADITFIIDEKRHHLFKREGNDLELGVEVPLVQALTGCTLTVPLLGGEQMTLTLNDILYPGYEKIISGQGMPKPKGNSRRGDLRLKFLVEFPEELSDEQRSEIESSERMKRLVQDDWCFNETDSNLAPLLIHAFVPLFLSSYGRDQIKDQRSKERRNVLRYHPLGQ